MPADLKSHGDDVDLGSPSLVTDVPRKVVPSSVGGSLASFLVGAAAAGWAVIRLWTAGNCAVRSIVLECYTEQGMTVLNLPVLLLAAAFGLYGVAVGAAGAFRLFTHRSDSASSVIFGPSASDRHGRRGGD